MQSLSTLKGLTTVVVLVCPPRFSDNTAYTHINQITGAGFARSGCTPGSYAVKIEGHHEGCDDPASVASIANYGKSGPCVDTFDGHNWLKAIKIDGCWFSQM